MNKLSRLTALLLALIMLLGSVSLAEGGLPIGGASGLTSDDWAALVDAAEDKLFFTDEGDTGKVVTPESPEQPEKPEFYPYTDVEALRLIQSETSAKATITASGAAVLIHEAAGQWQISLGGVWANLSGETGEALTVTRTMMNGQHRAEFRKALGEKNAETGEYAACTQTAVINIIENTPAMLSVSRDAENMAASDANDGIMTLELANQENMVIVQVIYRIQGTDQPVADAYIGQIAKGSTLNTTLILPRVTGYKANAIAGKAGAIDIPAEDLAKYAAFTAPMETDQGSLTLAVTKELSEQDITVYVEYAPAEVTFTVKHLQQNIDDDEYTEVEAARETRTGKTGAPVGDKLAKTYEGFSAIWYDPTTAIAADGSTVVEIYYNREYYLLTFDLGGGYGLEPIFARYETKIVVDEDKITRPGYTFAGWKDANGNEATVPGKMPAKDVELIADWTAADTRFIVAYWLENPNDDGYSFWGSYEENGKSGDTVKGADYQNYPDSVGNTLDGHEKHYSYYSHADSEVTVSGNGDTVVNVYYKREKFTLRFYFAMDDGADETTAKHYVVGGSTYYFGVLGGARSGLKALNDYYAQGNQIGEVDEVPQLNARGKQRGYKTGKEQYVADGYAFHYIEFTAKYGADISELWPCNVFESVTRTSISGNTNGWKGTEAFVSAWNGEYYVYYSQEAVRKANGDATYGNETIKGNYNQLDYQLLWDYQNGLGDSSTVSFLCFWENGAGGISWNKPKLFRYKIWVPVYEGQDTAELTLSDDRQYYLRNVYDTCDNSTAGEQTAPAIEGFEYTGYYVSKNLNKGEYDAAIYESAMDVNFYYSRNTYDLTFTNYGKFVKTEGVVFDQDISGKSFVPEYPDGQEKDALEFVSWYTTPTFIEGTEFKFDTMPAHDVALYAKWELVTHKVNFWLDADKKVSVVDYSDITHGMTIPERYQSPDDYVDPDEWLEQNKEHAYSKYDFAGWYYMDGDVEKRFDIKTMPIKTDMDIYAKWTSDEPVKFVFRYVHVDANGNAIEIAPPTEGLALPNSPVTMSAKIGADLTQVPNGNDPLSYIPEVSSHTLDIEVDEEKNVFVFKYHMPEKVEYTVQYLAAKYIDVDGKPVLVISLNDNGEPIHLIDEKTVETDKAVVTENYVPVPNRMPQATQLRLIVSMDAKSNVIQFFYVENVQDAPYNVSHYIVDHTGKASLHISETNKTGKINANVAVNKLNEADIPGYTFAYAKVAVPELKNGKWEDVLYDVPATQITGTHVTYQLPAAGMHVYLYYEPIKYPFVVQYLDDKTGEPLVDMQTNIPIEFGGGEAAYGSTLTTDTYVKTIADYRFVRFDPAQKTVEIETDMDNPTVNVLKIYYTLDVADISIGKMVTESLDNDAQKLTEEQWKTAFDFTVKLTDKQEKNTNEVKATIDGVDKTLTVQKGEVAFTLQHGQTAVLHDLWVGTKYKIEETEHADFKTSYSVTASGELTAMGVNMIVTNMYPKYVGELTITKTGMQDNKESAIVHAKVGSDEYYLVLNGSNNYTATISGIKPNTSYTVSEVTAWTWQYDSEVKPASGTITETAPSAVVTIDNTYKGDQWLHDESHVINNFGTEKSTGVND